jgi:hypothetical protein
MADDYLPVSTQSVFNSEGDLIGTIYVSIDGPSFYKEIGEVPEFVQVEEQGID